MQATPARGVTCHVVNFRTANGYEHKNGRSRETAGGRVGELDPGGGLDPVLLQVAPELLGVHRPLHLKVRRKVFAGFGAAVKFLRGDRWKPLFVAPGGTK